jgi:hypothetical protein
VVNQYDDLGFLDIRKNAAGVHWRSRSKLTMSGKTKACGEKTCYRKLATHGGQLAAVRVDGRHHLGVQRCRPHADVDAAVQQRRCGAICDFFIGGDRLFAVHSEVNVFDAAAADHLTAKRLVFFYPCIIRKGITNTSFDRKNTQCNLLVIGTRVLFLERNMNGYHISGAPSFSTNTFSFALYSF